MDKINNFTDLEAWKEGHQLALLVYRITKSFPREEMFGLTNQMRRCSVSVPSNIAEGFSRQSYKEKVQFYSISLGSATELRSQVLLAKDLEYIISSDLDLVESKMLKLHKLLNGLIKSSKKYP